MRGTRPRVLIDVVRDRQMLRRTSGTYRSGGACLLLQSGVRDGDWKAYARHSMTQASDSNAGGDKPLRYGVLYGFEVAESANGAVNSG